MKVCSKCHIEKDESEFYDKRASCILCERKRSLLYAKLNKEVIRERKRGYYESYYKKNKEKIKKRAKDWLIQNPERAKERFRKYYEGHKEQNKQYNRDGIKELRKSYVRAALVKKGYTDADIELVPDLLTIKKIQIINKRLKNETK